MEVTVETVSAVKRKIGVALPPDEVRAEIDQAYAGLQRHARIKGFRPGKVPRHVLERYYGDQVRSEVIGRLIQDSYAKALVEQGLEAVARPEIVAEEVRPEEGLRYSATIEIKPTFEVAGFEGLEVERALAAVPDEAVDERLQHLRESYAQMARLEDRDTVEQGDLVSVAYTGVVDGRALPGASASDRIIEIGSGTFPAPFEEMLVGKRVGESLHIPVQYPGHHHSKEIAGKTVTFRVEIKAVGRKELPALDDDFAKDHGECASLDELRARVRGSLEEVAARDADQRMRGALLKQLVERNPIDLPDALVEHRLDGMLHEVGAHGLDARDNPEMAAKLDELRSELRRRARESVHTALLLERLASQQGIEVSDAEIEDRIAAMVHAAPRERERLAALYRAPEARREVSERLAQEKALEWLVGQASVREVPASNSIAGAQKSS